MGTNVSLSSLTAPAMGLSLAGSLSLQPSPMSPTNAHQEAPLASQPLGVLKTQSGSGSGPAQGSSSSGAGQAVVSPRVVRALKFVVSDLTWQKFSIKGPVFKHILAFLDRVDDAPALNRTCKAWRYISRECSTTCLDGNDLLRALHESDDKIQQAILRCLSHAQFSRVTTVDLTGFEMRFDEGVQALMPTLFETFNRCHTFIAPYVGDQSVTSPESRQHCRSVSESVLSDLPSGLRVLDTRQFCMPLDLMFASAKPAKNLTHLSMHPYWTPGDVANKVQSVVCKLPSLADLEILGIAGVCEKDPSFLHFLEQCPQLRTLRFSSMNEEHAQVCDPATDLSLYEIPPHALQEVIFTSCDVDERVLQFFAQNCKSAKLTFINCKLPENYGTSSSLDQKTNGSQA